MSGVHKHPTISFRVSDREREMIEAKILASGMQKKDYFVRSCIYNRICVVGKKEVIYQLVEELQNMQTNISELVKQLEQQDVTLTADGLEDMRNDCMDMLQAIVSMLDGAKYLCLCTNDEFLHDIPIVSHFTMHTKNRHNQEVSMFRELKSSNCKYER